jgi:flagellar hook protein FlgE
MSLFSNLRTASSGLAVSSTSMSVIGDNIANVNTIGFKRGRASFADSFPVEVSYVHGPISIGTGAFTGATSNEFSQGALQISNNNLHMAISGNGFFTVREGDCNYYTRNGEFFLDKEGYFVSPMGLKLQGFVADEGEIQPQMGDLQVDLGQISSQASSIVSLSANLDSDADDSTTPLASMSLDGATEEISTIAGEADFSTSVAIYDSLGTKHDLTLCFEKNSTNNWTCYVIADGGDVVDQSTGTTMTDGMGFQIAQIDLTYDTDGSLLTYTQTDTYTTSPWNWEGAADVASYEFLFGLDAAGEENSGSLAQLSSDSTVTSLDQDGYSVGHLTSMQVQTDGTILGRYDNGQDIVLGMVSVATFDSTSGLERMGSNLFRATRIPGEPTFGIPGEGGRGDIFGSSLEASNVDIEDEFVNMITAQRSYQANSRVMSATNELLRELVNLV